MRTLFFTLLLLPAIAAPVPAAAPDAAAPPDSAAGGPVVFTRDVAPVLVQKCLGCHHAARSKGGYRVDTFEHLLRPGDSESPPVSPGRPEASTLYRLVSTADEHERMPQKDDPLPPGQVALIGRWIREGGAFDGADRAAPLRALLQVSHPPAPPTYPHPVPAVALSFRPDGAALAVGGYHEVNLWAAGSGKLLRRVGNVAQQTHALAYSPDGAALAVAGGTPGSLGEIRLVPTKDPSAARVLDRIGDVMLSLSFSPDGKTLAAGGADGAVRLYDVAGGERTLLIEPHADWVTAVAFSPDGKRFASASRDKSARVFDAATGDLLSAYPNHEEPLFALAWSPDGRHVYTAGREREIHAWEPAVEAKKVRGMKGFGGDVLRLAALGDHLYSTSADGKLRQHKRDTGELVKTIDVTPDHLTGLAADRGVKLIAVGTFDGSVRLFDAGTLEPRAAFVATP